MRHLVIIGAGGFGREVFGVAREAIGFGTDFDVKGFLDAKADALVGFAGYPPVIGDPVSYQPEPDDVFITALGSIAARRKCAAFIEEKGGRFISVIHRSAFLGPNVVIGEGCFLAPGVSLTADIRLGRHTDVFHNTSIGHDTRLGDFAHVYAQCAIGGGVTIEDGASIYPGSVVVPRRTIGANAVVGAGSTVFLSVPPAVTVHGNPAAQVH